jgi:hypothetical protein
MEGANSYKGHSIVWSGYEHQHEERSADWYWALGIIATSAAITSILFGNFLFALLIIVAALTLGIISTKDPLIVEFKLSDKGIVIGETLFSYSDIRAFWVDINEDEEESTLLIDTLKFMAPHLVIPIETIEAENIRDMLKTFVIEEELKEPISHKILELLGF